MQRLKPAVLAEDEASFNALQSVTGYAPANTAYAIAPIAQAFTAMREAQAAEDQQEAALATARDFATTKEWTVHNLVLGAKGPGARSIRQRLLASAGNRPETCF